MANAIDIQGVVYKNKSVTLLARVEGETAGEAVAITQSDLSAIKYSAYLLERDDPDERTAVSGHQDVVVVIASTIFDTLQTGSIWGIDATGYNFKHVLDVSANQVFAIAGRAYLIEFDLTPTSGQVIPVRFRCHVI